MLKLENVQVSIGKKRILEDVTMHVAKEEIVAFIGHNGAGKSTTLGAVLGTHRIQNGTIELNNKALTNLSTTDIVREGIGLVPQLNNVFRNLSVEENLELGSVVNQGENGAFTIEKVYEIFPILRERKKQLVGTMSGGQRQMVAIGIGLMSNPSYLLLDEPSVGIQPNLVDKVMETIVKVNKEFGISILIVEQNIKKVLEIADRVYVMSRGSIIKEFVPGTINSEELWQLM
ncbi:ABC transporter ATP-binding protein [Bacillus dakarensis]|uniref:ABC transporter ATP-binding protein n=1 Tax=Robertmurraya dakarensis TaxID=1926278 RepID=UPI000980B425|nr:ABC transporter ATP-binding protein [Bacillus dakarensis]